MKCLEGICFETILDFLENLDPNPNRKDSFHRRQRFILPKCFLLLRIYNRSEIYRRE